MDITNNSQFDFWIKYLKFISLFFAGMGVVWALLGSFDPFGIYDKAFANSFYGQDHLPEDVQKAVRFILAPFGATAAGYFILQYFIVKNALAKKEQWAWQAIMIAFVFWFVLDSLIHGAYFNILIANIPSLFAMLPLLFLRKNMKGI